MGQHLQLEWHETAEQLQLFYRWERNPHRKMRLQALWHLRCGKHLQEVADKGLLNSLIGWQWIQDTFAQVGDA